MKINYGGKQHEVFLPLLISQAFRCLVNKGGGKETCGGAGIGFDGKIRRRWLPLFSGRGS